MKFEKISDNKINIILDLNDLQEKNIDFHSFMSNSIESQNLFLDMLKQAEKELGFITSNYNIHIEGFASSDNIFIFTITRAGAIDIPKKKKVVYKRKILKPNNDWTIYSFKDFDDYYNFCKFLNKHFKNLNSFLKNSSLFSYNSNYYLILDNINIHELKTKHFFSYISEFANLCNNSTLFKNILFEHGEKLIPENALGVGMRYFG